MIPTSTSKLRRRVVPGMMAASGLSKRKSDDIGTCFQKWLVVLVAYPATWPTSEIHRAQRCDAWCEVGTCWYNYDGDVSLQSQTTAQLDNVDSEKVSCRLEDKQDEHEQVGPSHLISWSGHCQLVDKVAETPSWHVWYQCYAK